MRSWRRLLFLFSIYFLQFFLILAWFWWWWKTHFWWIQKNVWQNQFEKSKKEREKGTNFELQKIRGRKKGPKLKIKFQQTFISLTWVFNIRQTHLKTFYFYQKLLLSLYLNLQGGENIDIINFLDHFQPRVVIFTRETDYSIGLFKTVLM